MKSIINKRGRGLYLAGYQQFIQHTGAPMYLSITVGRNSIGYTLSDDNQPNYRIFII